jgi:RNA polymerase primary sigma factor
LVGKNAVFQTWCPVIDIDPKKIISKEEQEDKKVADDIVSHLDYEEDEKYLKIYLQDISGIQPMTDVTRSYLLMNIVEDNDKESLKLLTESYLEKIASWIEPFRGKGVLACDLVQEANLAMTAYIGQQLWLNNYEWKDKIKEGGQEDLLNVLKGIDEAVKELYNYGVDEIFHLRYKEFHQLRNCKASLPLL